MRDVLDLIFEFLISLVVIAGGGFLMFLGRGDATFITAMMALVIGFWFQSRSQASTVANLMKQFPIQTATLPLAAPVSCAPTPETTNPTNPPVVPGPTGNNI